jgi:precorrin-2 dehydrogenase / sirohydrochlorin ferrochelatase
MGFIPIFLQVEAKLCLVVGGGEVAARKAQALAAAGAAVTVISPQVNPVLTEEAGSGRIALLRRAYRDGDMAGHLLVYAATNDPELNRRLFEEARRLNILINVADSPDHCSFIAPSVIRRGRLQVAISTAGASPALARNIRERMEIWLGDELEVLLEIMAGARDWLKRHEGDDTARARKLNALAASDLGDALRRGDLEAAERIVAHCLGDAVRLTDLGVQAPAMMSKARPGDGA